MKMACKVGSFCLKRVNFRLTTTNRLYSLDTLINVCHTFMDRNATAMLVHESFKNLSQESLCGILKRDSFFAPEVLIFGAVSNWCKVNHTTDIEVCRSNHLCG